MFFRNALPLAFSILLFACGTGDTGSNTNPDAGNTGRSGTTNGTTQNSGNSTGQENFSLDSTGSGGQTTSVTTPVSTTGTSSTDAARKP